MRVHLTTRLATFGYLAFFLLTFLVLSASLSRSAPLDVDELDEFSQEDLDFIDATDDAWNLEDASVFDAFDDDSDVSIPQAEYTDIERRQLPKILRPLLGGAPPLLRPGTVRPPFVPGPARPKKKQTKKKMTKKPPPKGKKRPTSKKGSKGQKKGTKGKRPGSRDLSIDNSTVLEARGLSSDSAADVDELCTRKIRAGIGSPKQIPHIQGEVEVKLPIDHLIHHPPPHSDAVGCFPAFGFNKPAQPPASRKGWWCKPEDEHAFMGFSYALDQCQSEARMVQDFRSMRQNFKARYVRLYSACDKPGFNDRLINAAWTAGMGIYPLIWFGFDGDDSYKARMASLIAAINSNPKAPFVVRGVVVGSEPLFDGVLKGDIDAKLAQLIYDVRGQLESFTKGANPMQVTLSDMPYGYQSKANAPKVFAAVDVVQGNILPFFSQQASTGNSSDARKSLLDGYRYLAKQTNYQKKVLFTQTGWPSNAKVWPPNSKNAIASVRQEARFFRLLDTLACRQTMRTGPKGGLGWFAHIWTDSMLPGWGILEGDGSSGRAKFNFRPRVSCERHSSQASGHGHGLEVQINT